MKKGTEYRLVFIQRPMEAGTFYLRDVTIDGSHEERQNLARDTDGIPYHPA